METLAIIQAKKVLSVVQSMDIFFSREVKNQLLELCLYRHMIFLS